MDKNIMVEQIIISVYLGTHALIRFDDEETTTVIPVQRIKQVNSKFEVIWSNKKWYKASLILSG